MAKIDRTVEQKYRQRRSLAIHRRSRMINRLFILPLVLLRHLVRLLSLRNLFHCCHRIDLTFSSLVLNEMHSVLCLIMVIRDHLFLVGLFQWSFPNELSVFVANQPRKYLKTVSWELTGICNYSVTSALALARKCTAPEGGREGGRQGGRQGGRDGKLVACGRGKGQLMVITDDIQHFFGHQMSPVFISWLLVCVVISNIIT